MDKSEIQKKILEEEDYVRCPKLGNSLNRFTAKNPEGVENSTIARLLLMSEEEVERVYLEAVAKLREAMDDEN
jgi:hypothetical protein